MATNYADKARECLQLSEGLAHGGDQMRQLALCWERLLLFAKEQAASEGTSSKQPQGPTKAQL